MENPGHSVTKSTQSETALHHIMENPGHSVIIYTHKVSLPYITPWKTQGIQSPYTHTKWVCLISHLGKPRAFSHHIHTQSESALYHTMENPGHSVIKSTQTMTLLYSCFTANHAKHRAFSHHINTQSQTALHYTVGNPGHSVTTSTHKVRLFYSKPWKTQGIQSPNPHTKWDCLTSHHGKPRAFSLPSTHEVRLPHSRL